MSTSEVSVVFAHGAWADGSSWVRVMSPLIAAGHKVLAASLPLTSFEADIAAVERTLTAPTVVVEIIREAIADASVR